MLPPLPTPVDICVAWAALELWCAEAVAVVAVVAVVAFSDDADAAADAPKPPRRSTTSVA